MLLSEKFARQMSETSALCTSCERQEAKPKCSILHTLSSPIQINKVVAQTVV